MNNQTEPFNCDVCRDERVFAQTPCPKVCGFEKKRCGMCGYVGVETDDIGQCPKCRWDELQPVAAAQ